MWSAGGYTTPVISGVAAGVYSITVTGPQLGCILTSTVQLSTLPLPTLTVAGNFSICSGNMSTVTVTGASTYTWDTGSPLSQLTVSPTANTIYTVTGTNTLGCSASSIVSITVFGCVGLGETPEEQSPVVIYPNPNSGSLFIESKLPLRLTIYDPLGQVIRVLNLDSGQQQVDLSGHGPGIYLVKLSTGSTVFVHRVIKDQ